MECSAKQVGRRKNDQRLIWLLREMWWYMVQSNRWLPMDRNIWRKKMKVPNIDLCEIKANNNNCIHDIHCPVRLNMDKVITLIKTGKFIPKTK